MQRLRIFGASVVALAVASVAGACSTAPVSGGTIGLGVQSGVAGAASVIYQYDGTAGEQVNVGLEFPGVSTLPLHHYPAVQAPDGTTAPLARSGCVGESQFAQCAAFSLPVTGRYTVLVTPNIPLAPSAAFVLTLSHDEQRGPVPFGTLLPASTLLGQEITYTYAGTAGESVNIAGDLRSPTGTQVNYSDGTYTLPVTGTYTLALHRRIGALSHDLQAGPIGLGETVTPPRLPAQRVAYSYEGTAGEGLGYSSGVGLRGPDGNPVPEPGCCGRWRRDLPVTGTYTVLAGATVSSIWLQHDFDGGPLLLGTWDVPDLPPGQSIAYEYTGTIGERITVTTEDDLGGAGSDIWIYRPDGSYLTSWWHSESFTVQLVGAYRIVITPSTFDPNPNRWVSLTVTA